MQRERIDQAHQSRYCLTADHANCPWLVIAPSKTAAESQPDSTGRRLLEEWRERFEELDLVSRTEGWGRTTVSLAVFIAKMIKVLSIEAYKGARPALRVLWEWLKVAVAFILLVIWRLLAGIRRVSAMAFQRGETQFRRILARRTGSADFAGPEVDDCLPATVEDTIEIMLPQPDNPAIAGRAVAPRRFLAKGRWECLECLGYNPDSEKYCQRCGRLSPTLADNLEAIGETILADGMRALQAGDEERARELFVAKIVEDPLDEVAWYWRARTSDTIEELIYSLEQLVYLDSENTRFQADLAFARERRALQQALLPVQDLELDQATVRTQRPSMAKRLVVVVRRLALEVASIPSLLLGFLWFGERIVDEFDPILVSLSIDGAQQLKQFIPAFSMPTVMMVTLPAALRIPGIPETFDLMWVFPPVLAIWFVWLSLRLANGLPGARINAIAGSVVALGSSRLIVADGQIFIAAALVLLGLSLLGRREMQDELDASGGDYLPVRNRVVA
jgi:uncharacterized membrane protein